MWKKLLIIGIILIVTVGIMVYANPKQVFTKMYLRFSGEYKAPEYETSETILSAVREKNLKYDRLFKVTSTKALNDFQQKGILSIPFIQFYNSNKKLITVASGDECKWNLMELFVISDTSQLVESDSTLFDFISQNVIPLHIKSYEDTFKYYVIAGWVNYLPKMKANLFSQTDAIKDSLGQQVCISYINLDFQEEWQHAANSLREK